MVDFKPAADAAASVAVACAATAGRSLETVGLGPGPGPYMAQVPKLTTVAFRIRPILFPLQTQLTASVNHDTLIGI